jgi:broad-specificity NMP kinase
MGASNYLIEGVSGAGKTSVATELERRGYHVAHGDRVLAFLGDPETGEPLSDVARAAADTEWLHQHWIWDVAKVNALATDHSHARTFFCGGARNARRFIDLFDEVFVLELDAATLDRRLATRGDDEFGGKPQERALVARLHASRADLPARAVSIDATQPLATVVDAILAACAAVEAG